MLRHLNITLNIFGIKSWGYFLFIPAIVFTINGIRQLFHNKKIKNTLLNLILNRGYGKVRVKDLSEEIEMNASEILNLLSVLRKKGKIAYKFDSNMNEITVLSIS